MYFCNYEEIGDKIALVFNSKSFAITFFSMKKILLFIVVFLCVSLSMTSPKVCQINAKELFRNILPDTLLTLVEKHPTIFYTYGHYGYSWALLVKLDNKIQAFSGRVSSSGECFFTESTEFSKFDTVSFCMENRGLLLWGFDTIASEADGMRGVRRTHFVTFDTKLDVFNSDGENVFNSGGAIAFSGRDSLEFNKKYQRLCLIMRWISDAEFRQYITDP